MYTIHITHLDRHIGIVNMPCIPRLEEKLTVPYPRHAKTYLAFRVVGVSYGPSNNALSRYSPIQEITDIALEVEADKTSCHFKNTIEYIQRVLSEELEDVF